jgi:hypothetical protein
VIVEANEQFQFLAPGTGLLFCPRHSVDKPSVKTSPNVPWTNSAI